MEDYNHQLTSFQPCEKTSTRLEELVSSIKPDAVCDIPAINGWKQTPRREVGSRELIAEKAL